MYGQEFQGWVLFLMLYAGVTVLNLVACCYLLFRRGNTIAPDVMSPVRLRKWTAALMAALALSHLWYLPFFFLTSSDDARLCFLLGGLLDCLTIFPLAIVTLFVMLQDRSRPLWPAAAMVAPLVVGMALCVASRSMAVMPILYVYLILLNIGLIVFMARALRQYGRWLRDNYADLEHKEVWQSFTVLGIFLLLFGIYAISAQSLVYGYVLQVYEIVLTCFLVWRVETLSDLSISLSQDLPTDTETTDKQEVLVRRPEKESQSSLSQKNLADDIEPLLQKYCVDTQLYLQHGLTLAQLAKTIGTNRFYLSQYFSSKGMNYNTYINDLRINHFVSLHREAVATHSFFTIQQLAYESGYRSYSTFNSAFKQRMGHTVNAWAQLQNLQ